MLEKAAERLTLPADANHLELAENYLDRAGIRDGVRPVFSQGAIYSYSAERRLWCGSSLDALAAEVGRVFSGYKLCRRLSDYRQISSLVATLCEDSRFFADAPNGVAAADRFFRVTTAGEIECQPLNAGHRQRMAVPVLPDFDGASPLFNGLLDNAFGFDDAGAAQRELLQEALGSALTGALSRFRVVLMLLGPSATGKTTLLEILKGYLDDDRVGATNPQSWGSEYHAAALAGRSLNIVGELDPQTPIPGGIFKAVTGGDVIEARHPNHRPFPFVCTASHVFNGNRLPPTRDKSDAFFRRWRIVEFANSIPPGREIIGLAERILDEEQAAVLGWLLTGAARAAKRGSLPVTENHRRLMDYWRAANNSALQFLLDRAHVTRSTGHTVSAKDVYASYRKWAYEVGIKQPLGRNAFYEAVAEGAVRIGVTIADDRDGVRMMTGVSLLQ